MIRLVSILICDLNSASKALSSTLKAPISALIPAMSALVTGCACECVTISSAAYFSMPAPASLPEFGFSGGSGWTRTTDLTLIRGAL